MKVINKKYCTSGSYFVVITNKSLIIKRWKGKREKYFVCPAYIYGWTSLYPENGEREFVVCSRKNYLFNSFRYLN